VLDILDRKKDTHTVRKRFPSAEERNRIDSCGLVAGLSLVPIVGFLPGMDMGWMGKSTGALALEYLGIDRSVGVDAISPVDTW
jgi:hypothetical protein